MDHVDGISANTSKGTVRKVLELVLAAPGAKILDAPAGRGALSAQLVKAGKSVTAVELDPATIEAKGIEGVAANLEMPLPFDDNSFDTVACVDGIEHLQNPFHVVREFHRVLKPSGSLVLSTPNISAWRSRARYLFTGFHNKGKLPLTEEAPNPLHHINLLSYPSLRYMLVRFGFQITTVTANRVKPVAYPYALLYPAVALATKISFRRESDAKQRELNRDIYAHLLSWPVTMGETIIIKAHCQK